MTDDSAASADADDPSHGNLLEFEPVPRSGTRVDGWSAERQRAFIALLATTGSTRRAAKALEMSPHGIIKLRQAKGADSFNAAYDRAMAIAARNGAMKIAASVADTAARGPSLRKKRGEKAASEPSDMSDDDKRDFLENIVLKFLRKVQAERQARLAGEVVAADFYLRQVTVLEVALDLLSEGVGLDGWEVIGDLRRGGHGILDIAETRMSRILDGKRRELWAKMAEPERPEHPPQRYLEHHKDHSIEPGECFRGGEGKDWKAEQARYAARHAEEAERQAAWEAGLKLPLPPAGAPGSEPFPGRFDPAAGWGEGDNQ